MRCFKIYSVNHGVKSDITRLVTTTLASVSIDGFACASDARMSLAFFVIGNGDEWWKEESSDDPLAHIWTMHDVFTDVLSGRAVEPNDGTRLFVGRAEETEGVVYE